MSDIFGGMFDEFSVAYVEMLEAKSRLWKRSSKKWRRQALAWQAWGEAHKADADRRGELLKRALLQLEIHAPRQVPLMDEIVEELADA